jgi:hypothetical protein
MFFIKTDTGERFSVISGFSVLGPVTRFISPTEALGEFHRCSYRANGADPRYFIVNEKTGVTVEEIRIFEVKR